MTPGLAWWTMNTVNTHKSAGKPAVLRVLLVEDSVPVRQRIRSLIEESCPVEIVGETGSASTALALFQVHQPHAVVLDLNLAEGDGVQVLATIKRSHPACVVVVLTNFDIPESRGQCVWLGADHFFHKSSEFERVPEVLAELVCYDAFKPVPTPVIDRAHAAAAHALRGVACPPSPEATLPQRADLAPVPENLMNLPSHAYQPRILVIDDNIAIHDVFRQILGSVAAAGSVLQPANFAIDVATQGAEALALVQQAVAAGRPYAVAFVDIHMPPGWDGIETARRLWHICPAMQIVICTAYPDFPWADLQEQIKPRDRLLILKKPFDAAEVLQLAYTLTEKWRLQHESSTLLHNLEASVQLRTQELEAARLDAISLMEEAVQSREKDRQSCESLRHEMTERSRLEQRFRDQAALLDKTSDAIVTRDLAHRITYWNKGAEQIYGWTSEEVIGRSFSELHYRDAAPFEQACAAVVRLGEWHGELREVNKAGTPVLVEGRWTLLRDAAGRPHGILAINTDITEKNQLQQQFLRAQRMDSIGTLAGGIAHDLNNALAPIMMSIELLKLREQNPQRMSMLATIEGSAKHGADMVRQLLSFARGVEGKRLVVQVGHLLKEIEKFANETFLKTIQVRSDIPRDLWTVQGDPTQLHQVLLNLCVNARDAMPGGGTLKLAARNLMLDEHYVGLNGEGKPGPHLLIQVADTGTGMPPAVIERIFEPFYTTKELGKGTGLGLSTTLGIIKSHGGFLRVNSEVGQGTLFRIYLPAQAAVAADAAAPVHRELPHGHGELVLVVDDESAVREITRQTLEAFGYRVLLACDGAEATALYSVRKQDIAAVLTDMMMPVMDGPSTIQTLMRINPEVRIIAATGLNANGIEANAVNAGVKHFLPKPYTAETLLIALQAVL
ncbi:MAG: response regulator [Prosthecobacter sp.]|uniref:response regulator n=1 Tax=Prosthecobacter sp. TaxID=1965333 RepID=UPI0039003108